jgi:hypothetical protein
MTLNGFDISNVNGAGIISRALTGDFVICKATEGKSFVDPLYPSFMAQIRRAGKLTGSYHFAHWANNPRDEAAFYGAHNDRRDGEFEILDWEMYGTQACPANVHGPWVAEFLAARPRCGIYLNDDMANHIVASADATQLKLIRSRVLWKATYGVSNPGNTHGFDRGATLWQWRDSTGIDEDTAYLTPQEWRALANGQPGPPTPPEDILSWDTAFDNDNDPNTPPQPAWTSVRDARVYSGNAAMSAEAANARATEARDAANSAAAGVKALVDLVTAMPKPLTADEIEALVQKVIAGQVNVTATLSVDPPTAKS